MSSDIPKEAYYHIFKYVGSSAELQKLRTVSKQWKDVIETYFKASMVVTCENWLITQKASNIEKVTFRSFTFPFPSSILFANQLSTVNFSNIVLSRNLVSILQKCSQLESLMFNQIILDQRDFIKVPMAIELEKLKVISIFHKESPDYKSLDVLLQFLSKSVSYGQLQDINFWVPNSILGSLPINILFDKSYHSTHWLFELILNNRGSLRNIKLGSWKKPISLHLFTQLNGIVPHKALQSQIIEAASNLPPEWTSFLSKQHFVSRLYIDVNAFNWWTAGITQAVVQSEDVLREISCVGGGTKHDLIDLAIFKNCSSLEVLVLQFNYCRLLSVALLPISIVILNLNGPMSKHDFASISYRLVNLQTLCVNNGDPMQVGTAQDESSMNVKVNLLIFTRLVSLPKLKTLSLHHCSMSWANILQWCRVDSAANYILRVDVNSTDEKPFGLSLEVIDRKQVMADVED